MSKKSKVNKAIETKVIEAPIVEKVASAPVVVENVETTENTETAPEPIEDPELVVAPVAAKVGKKATELPEEVPEGKVRIEFNNKPCDCTPVEPGIVQKTDSIYYIQDCVTKKWLYCSPERLLKLRSKPTDFANYMGRDSAKTNKEQVKVAKKVAREVAKEAAKDAFEAEMAKHAPAAAVTEVAPEVPAEKPEVPVYIAPELVDDIEG